MKWRIYSRRKSKASVPAVEPSNSTAPSTSKRKSRAWKPPKTSPNAEIECSQLAPPSKSSPSDLPTRPRSRSADGFSDPLGLSVLYEPEADPSVDIIFVHGLGGTSRATWCYKRDRDFFWPQKWLPLEPGIQTARLLSFGYNPRFSAPGPAPITGISDFAKDLLFGMKFAKNDRLGDLGIGERPIIFKAYILGQNSGDYEEIVSSIKAIMFLATPYRGTHLAELLNRVLSASIFSHSPKQYIAELSNTSQALEDLNEQFRFIAPKLQIMSFYETLPTRIGPKKMIVLERNSSILGYPTETSKSLNADHNDVCKYETTQDPNYISVRNALKTVISTLLVGGQITSTQGKLQIKQLETLFALAESPSEDLAFFQNRWTPGTCGWILSEPEYMRWVDGDKGCKVLWLHALPATGKSVLSSFIINNLIEAKKTCAYHFFRFGDRTKRSLSACLQSLAFQVAEQLPPFRKTLLEMSNSGIRFDEADVRAIWKKIYTSLLFRMTHRNTFYWVIDGLDEADSPQLFVELIKSIYSTMFPIKVLLISRRSPELISAVERLAVVGPIQNLAIRGNEQDIRRYVEQEIEFMHAPRSLKDQIVEKLLERASGNFLWVNIALAEILQCLTPPDIEETLEGLPNGMGEIYHQMELSISKSTRPRDQDLGRAILTWATCPRRPLTLPGLEQALKPEFPVLFDLRFTISQVCGQFVVIDSSKQIVMVHQTAREYLLKSTESLLAVTPVEAHQKMFAKCIYFLKSSTQGRTSERRKSSHLSTDKEPFLHYAAASWPYHLGLTSTTSYEPLTIIARFLQNMSVLAWISLLAEYGQLGLLVQASRALHTFVYRRRKLDVGIKPPLHQLEDLELVELWATDLIKIVGKFGPNLTTDPWSIYKQIPPFCPRDSMIHKQFGINTPGFSVNGISSTSWDDSLAKTFIGSVAQALKIVCSGNHFAVLVASGLIVLYHPITFEAIFVLPHGERVCATAFSHGGDRFASCGFDTTKVWSVAIGKVLLTIQNPASRAMKITFSANDDFLLMASADRGIRIAPLNVLEPAWSFVDQRLLREDSHLSGTVLSSPCCISFSPDATHIAIAYRGFPLSVWRIDPPELISRCRRNLNNSKKFWNPVNHVVWHPYSGEVLGIYASGSVFKWHPYSGIHEEIPTSATLIAISPAGNFFAICEGSATIKLYKFDHLTLVYQLYCESLVHDIAFSPDNRRLYDLRAKFCNIWEPNVLLKLDDPQGAHHAISYESGIVSIFDSSENVPPIELFRSETGLGIWHLNWGEDGQHLACAYLGGGISVKLVIPPGSHGKWATKSISDIRMENMELEGIRQMLFDVDSTILLVVCRKTARLLSTNAKFNAVLRTLPAQLLAARWITHPTDPTLLLAFTFRSVWIYRWHELTQIAVVEIIDEKAPTGNRPPPVLGPSEKGNASEDKSLVDRNEHDFKINRLIVTPTGSHILFQYAITTKGEGQFRRTLIFDTLDCQATNFAASSTKVKTGVIKPIFIPEAIETRVEVPLGILQKNRFVFLDQDFSMCSVRLTATGVDENSKQAHFFLPRDWLNSDCIELCSLLPDGEFLIPHKGDIAMIKSSVMLEW